MNIEQQQIKLCSLCVILTSTIGAESCGKILIQDVINNIGITILFSIVNEKNEWYKARSAISLLQMNDCFHTILGVSNLKYSIHAILAIQFVFPLILTSTQMTADTIRSSVQTNWFADNELQLDEASYSNTPSFV